MLNVGKLIIVAGGIFTLWIGVGLAKACSQFGASGDDLQGLEHITLAAPDGDAVSFILRDGYTPYERILPSGRAPLLVDVWLSDFRPYWDVKAEYRDRGVSATSKDFLEADFKNHVAIELHVDGKRALRIRKETTVLPAEVPRDFETKFEHFYFLGKSKRLKNSRPGRVFAKRPNGKVEILSSSRYWYVPKDESAYPAAYIRCTALDFEPKVKGSCTAFQELNEDIYFKYRFSAHHIQNWPKMDRKIRLFLNTALQKY